MKRIECYDCLHDKFNVEYSKTTIHMICLHCGTTRVMFTEEWL